MRNTKAAVATRSRSPKAKAPTINQQIAALQQTMQGMCPGSDFTEAKAALRAGIATLRAYIPIDATTVKRIRAIADFLEVSAEYLLEHSLCLPDIFEHPGDLENVIDGGDFYDGQPEKLERVRKKCAALIRKTPVSQYDGAAHREWWARIIECGRLPGDNGTGSGAMAMYLKDHPTLPPFVARRKAA